MCECACVRVCWCNTDFCPIKDPLMKENAIGYCQLNSICFFFKLGLQCYFKTVHELLDLSYCRHHWTIYVHTGGT